MCHYPLIVPYFDGIFYDSNQDLCSLDNLRHGKFGSLPYVMDQYENLFMKNDCLNFNGRDNCVNHSSFNAGSGVVCAGTFVINEDGHLLSINNNSGHYKPDGMAMHRCVKSLYNQGANLQSTLVVVTNQESAASAWHASTFIDNPKSDPDWSIDLDDRLQLRPPGII